MLSFDQFQHFLDDISDCFIDRDFRAWEAPIELPFSMMTTAGTVLIKDQIGLRQNFNRYLSVCRVLQINTIVRKPLKIETCSDGNFIGTCNTELLSHGVRTTDPYRSSVLIRWLGSELKMISILNARGHHAWSGVYPVVENTRIAVGAWPSTDAEIEYQSAS